MKRVSVIHRHFSGVIELGPVYDDFRLQFCGEPRPGMKLARVVHGAIVRRSDIHRHLVGVGVFAAVEPDVAFGPCTHGKGRESNPESHTFQNYFS